MEEDYSLAEFVPFDSNVHMEEFKQMNIEYLSWIFDQLYLNYQLVRARDIAQTIPEFVDDRVEPYTNLKPPEGIVYLLVVDQEVAGMGALRKLNEEVGEIKRMYNRPQYRGRGYGRKMLNRLLEFGREFECSSFLLDTPKFSHVAHHIYKSAGFKERDEYPESEILPEFRQYYLFMEKKI